MKNTVLEYLVYFIVGVGITRSILYIGHKRPSNGLKEIAAYETKIEIEDSNQRPIMVESVDELIERVLLAIEQEESDGVIDKIGDDGRAIGCLQIWKIYVDDVNRILKQNKYTYSDRYNRAKSFEMARIVLRHYCTEARLGHKPTWTDYAATHQRPSAVWDKDKPAIAEYINRVGAELEKLNIKGD